MYQGPVGDLKLRRSLCCVAVSLLTRDKQQQCDADCAATKESRQQQAQGSHENQ